MTHSDITTAQHIEVGTIVADWFDDGLRIIIMRGPVSFCAYIGIPEDHPLAGFSYDDLPVHAHGGLTFASEGYKQWPQHYYWYGWDYAHLGDKTIHDSPSTDEKDWTIAEIKQDIIRTISDFKKLMHLAESIKQKN